MRQTTRLPSEIIFAVLPSSPPSHPMSLSKLVYETSSEPMTSPPSRISTIPRYSDEACLCVTDLRRDTTLSKGMLNFTLKMHAAFFSLRSRFTFLLPLRESVCQLRSEICAERGAAYNDEWSNWFISNDAFSHPHVCTKFSRPNGYLKTNVTAKRMRVIRARVYNAPFLSLTVIHNTYVLLSHMRPIITTFRMAGELHRMNVGARWRNAIM